MNRPVHIAPRLRLHCLGHFRLRDFAGNELTPRTRKARALLAVLALSGRPCSREQLADLLWSDRGAEQAKSSFRQAIFELRHLDNAESAVWTAQRDDVSLNAELVETDVWAIREAAEADDLGRLWTLLDSSEPGLLTNLDGLDPEYDAWLHIQRANEPSLTLGVALAAARRGLDQPGPQAAQAVVAEIQRLEPTSEEATRLAIEIAHRLGDQGAVHRHYERLRDRLRTEYDAKPSPETRDLFQALTGDAIPSARESGNQLPNPEPGSAAPMTNPPPRVSGNRRWTWAIPAAAMLGVAGVAAWQIRLPAPSVTEAPLLAVLPFEESPKGDGSLAEGLWDDTRTLISQNGTVRVLGRTTSQAMAGDRLAPKAYRDRLGVDYLLDGSVQRQGDRVRVTVSLTRTADGVGVWEQAFDGRLGDPLTLQGAVAQGIEGRIRGRLAQGGGALAEQIATDPEVYSLYSQARSRMRARDIDGVDAAILLLRRAIARDPNFAPARASLAIAISLGRPYAAGRSSSHREAIAEARRAIDLAPNLSQAHASLALVEGLGSPVAEQAAKRAVVLDPSNAEAWTWLGNIRNHQSRPAEAMQAYWRAVEIDPLWIPAAGNLASELVKFGDVRAVERLANRIDRTGSGPELALYVRSAAQIQSGDYSAALAPLLAYRKNNLQGSAELVKDGLANGLMRLGYYREVATIWDKESWFAPVMRGEAVPPDMVNGTMIQPRDYWLATYFSVYASRATIRRGHARDLVDKYHRGFSSSNDFIATVEALAQSQKAVPNLAVALIETGDKAEANQLLTAVDKWLTQGLARSGNDRDLMMELARVRAIQQRPEEALRLVSAAIARGWLPDGLEDALDLTEEPAFRDIRSDPRFKALRARILAHIARERAELGPVRI